ncbi:MAG: long-chain fatty acid--CoA ligase [Deferribacterota bacterium]|nr:long-chain fatty acid--CoA ligase [Deferribacterota bacterium]
MEVGSKEDVKPIYTKDKWVKSYAEGVNYNIDIKKKTVLEMLYDSAKKYPNNTALIFEGYKLTYAKLVEMIDRLATALVEMGVKKGDKVATILPNIIHKVVSYYAIQRANAIAVLNNPLYSDDELQYQLNDSSSKIVITAELLNLTNRLIDLKEKTKIEKIITCNIGDYLPFPKSILFPLVARKQGYKFDLKKVDFLYHFKDLVNKTEAKPPKLDLSWEDTACLLYTGGTTGISKGVMLTHKNLSSNVQQIAEWFKEFEPTAPQEVHMGALPYFHSFGMTCSLNLPLTWGSTVVLIPRPYPDQLLEAIKKYRVTFFAAVPAMYVGIVNHPKIKDYDLSCIKGCFSGAAPIPVEIIKKFNELTGASICEGYGLTESTPVTHINPFGESAKRVPGSIGLPIPNTECKIVDIEQGEKEMPIGEDGELIIKGPQVMKGYYEKIEETKNTIRNGWLYTGDIARMDKDGYFYIVDRKKDLVISGGYNIYPREIDEVLYKHPKVKAAVAVGIPDEYKGEVIKAYIQLKDGETATEEEIREYCDKHLAKYKRPKYIEFRDDLPITIVGKVLRRKLREEEAKKQKEKN